MREILFRGKRTDGKGWIEGYYFQKPNPFSQDGLPIHHGISDLPPFGAEVIPETVGQFTGLTDKNGKRVFEGDIIGYWSDYHKKRIIDGVVVYGEFNCTCCNGVYGWVVDRGDIRCIDDNEVIGNVHDNPELIEEREG